MSNVIITPVDLRDRTLVFAKDVYRFVKECENNSTARPILSQLVRSASSIGANFVEAKNASSKRDFRSKVFISKKEASETKYWLNICEEFAESAELSRLQSECQEIILILQRIITPLKH